jgi:hypothetical protein
MSSERGGVLSAKYQGVGVGPLSRGYSVLPGLLGACG